MWGRGNWRKRKWGGSCCLSPHLCSGSWEVSLQLLEFTFRLAGAGHMTAASECSEGLSAFTWHWLTGCETVQHHREKIFPLSMTSPSQEWGKWREERGHSWWQLQYHLLLTKSSCCVTYKLALLWTRIVAVWSPSHLTSYNITYILCFFLLFKIKMLNSWEHTLIHFFPIQLSCLTVKYEKPPIKPQLVIFTLYFTNEIKHVN